VRQRRPTSSVRRTAFALDENEGNSAKMAKREPCISQDCQIPKYATSMRENTENANSKEGSPKDESPQTPPSVFKKVSYKPKPRGKVQKQPRTIIVHLHNKKRAQLTFTFKAAEMKPVLRVQLVKDSLAKILNLSSDVMGLFGIFSGSIECPAKLFRDNSSLPEGNSHFTLQLLGFCWDDKQNSDDSNHTNLIASAIRSHSEHGRILPPLNMEEKEILSERNSTDSIAIATIVKTHSFSVSNQAYVQPFPSLVFAKPTTKMDIQVALDMKGVHFFNVTGETLLMTFQWATISQVKCQIEPTCLFMFDIVVEEHKQYLRSIVVQTPHCEYLTSIAESILTLHHKKPEVVGRFEYLGNFGTQKPKFHPYDLVQREDIVSFKECIANGYSYDIKKIYSITRCISNKAYESPHYIYKPNLSEVPSKLEGLRYNILFRTFQVIYHFKNTYRKIVSKSSQRSIDPNMIFLIIPVNGDRSVTAIEVKMAIIMHLQLKKDSAKLFGLFLHKSSTNTPLYLFSDDDTIPDGYYEFTFRSLIFNWSTVVDPPQWTCIQEDEKAAKLLFWEIISAHRLLMNEVDEMYDLLINSCTLWDFVREMGALADLHTVTCTVKKIPDCIAKYVGVGEKVILSMDAGWLHLWKYDSGQRIANWNWNTISTIRRESTMNERVKFEIFVPNKSGKHNHQRYQTLAVETKCASYVMTVTGFILDGYKSHYDRIRTQDHLLCKSYSDENRRKESSTENEMKLTDVNEDGDKEIKGIINTFFQDEDLTENMDCLSCTNTQHISEGTNKGNIESQMHSKCHSSASCENRNSEEHMKAEIDGRDGEQDTTSKMLGVYSDSLCQKIDYSITRSSTSEEFIIKHDGFHGCKFLKDVLVQPESQLIDVVGYYWNRNFTGSLGRRHRHKVLVDPRDVVSFRTILPEDGLFPTCHLDLPQCCFSVSVPHLIRPLALLASLSQTDGRKFFTCFSTKPYRYRI